MDAEYEYMRVQADALIVRSQAHLRALGFSDKAIKAMTETAYRSPFGIIEQVPNEGHPFFQGERREPRAWKYPVC